MKSKHKAAARLFSPVDNLWGKPREFVVNNMFLENSHQNFVNNLVLVKKFSTTCFSLITSPFAVFRKFSFVSTTPSIITDLYIHSVFREYP
jgi:hypothetical protein